MFNSRHNSPVVLLAIVVLVIGTISPAGAASLNLVGEEGSTLRSLSAWQNDGEWLVDLADFFRALDFNVDWEGETDRFEVQKDGTEMRFRPDTERVLVDEGSLRLVSAPALRDDRLYIDASALVNLMNRHTDQSMIWNPSRQQLQLASSEAWAQDRQSDPIGSFIDEMPEDEEFLVVLDPGHGGRDPGAIGHNGVQEKRVVLEISKRIRDHLESQYDGIEVRLTRTSDQFLPLSQRTQIANDLDADLFISIHANANRSSHAKGFEVYTLSGEATNPSAKELASIENSALRYEGVEGEELDDISFILHQLTQHVNARESRQVSQVIMERAKNLPIPTRRARQAPFWVLKDARMPAMLVETGFLSNPSEVETIQTESYQRSVARVIGKAIEEYRSERFE